MTSRSLGWLLITAQITGFVMGVPCVRGMHRSDSVVIVGA